MIFNVISRAQGVDYLSDVEFLAKTTPAPVSYRPNVRENEMIGFRKNLF